MKTVESASPPFELAVQYAEDAAELPSQAELQAWVQAVHSAIGSRRGEVTVRFVGEEEMADLNGKYRGKPQPTNVLSFDYRTDAGADDGAAADELLGDVLVCVPVVQREALAMNIPLAARYAHLVVHGVLHLAGYRHDDDEVAAAMETLEAQILRQFNIDDP